MKLKDLEGKRILVLGLGLEGKSTLRYLLEKFPNQELGLADKKPEDEFDADLKDLIKKNSNFKLHLGENYLDSVQNYDVVIKSPGINLKESDDKVTSQTELFINEFRDKIIGVTGTKGKSTTSSLIYTILKDANKSVELVGNIGKPPFDCLVKNAELFVFELSSYQLQNLQVSPHVAVFLNIYPEHLDYHLAFEDYANAKSNIFKWQSEGDFVIYNEEITDVVKLIANAKAKKMPFKTTNPDFHLPETNLKGAFNLNNIAAAMTVAKLLEIDNEIVTRSVISFKPIKHRLQFVGNFKGIDFYNDSIATIPQATIAALETLSPNVSTLILGGLDRGLSFKDLALKIKDEQIANLILFPTTGKIISDEIKKLNYYPKEYFVDNMKEAVHFAYQATPQGKICLLSPAASSYNIFKNFEDRGEQFTSEVKNLN